MKLLLYISEANFALNCKAFLLKSETYLVTVRYTGDFVVIFNIYFIFEYEYEYEH